jgi:hypothetical protein
MTDIDYGRILELAELITPRLVAEYGRTLTLADIAHELEGTDNHPEVKGLNDGDLELLVDEILDLAPTLPITVG